MQEIVQKTKEYSTVLQIGRLVLHSMEKTKYIYDFASAFYTCESSQFIRDDNTGSSLKFLDPSLPLLKTMEPEFAT